MIDLLFWIGLFNRLIRLICLLFFWWQICSFSDESSAFFSMKDLLLFQWKICSFSGRHSCRLHTRKRMLFSAAQLRPLLITKCLLFFWQIFVRSAQSKAHAVFRNTTKAFFIFSFLDRRPLPLDRAHLPALSLFLAGTCADRTLKGACCVPQCNEGLFHFWIGGLYRLIGRICLLCFWQVLVRIAHSKARAVLHNATKASFSFGQAYFTARYGVATISRLLKIIGLFCKRALQKRPTFCKRDL